MHVFRLLREPIQQAKDLGEFYVEDIKKIRLVMEEAGITNTIVLSARIQGQSNFVIVDSFTGNFNKVISVKTWDYLKIECTVYSSLNPIPITYLSAASYDVELDQTVLLDSTSEIVISHENDSMKIGDGVDFLAVNPDGSINVQIENLDLAVELSDIDGDSVKIGDGTGAYLDINGDGSLNVNVISATAVVTSKYTEVTGVATGVTVLIGTYTALATTRLQKVEFSGTNIAEYELVINGITEDKKRTYFGSSLNDTFYFNSGLPIPIGQVIEIYAVHNRPSTGDFNSRIQTLEG